MTGKVITVSSMLYGYGAMGTPWPGQEACPVCLSPAVYDPVQGVLECDHDHRLTDEALKWAQAWRQSKRSPPSRPATPPRPAEGPSPWEIRPAGKRKLSL